MFVYPRARLLELEAEGVFGRLADDATSKAGVDHDIHRACRADCAGNGAGLQDQGVNLVLLVPFCPACHWAPAMTARGLEARRERELDIACAC
jgi:D-proline reductase (dithiol) PrdB